MSAGKVHNGEPGEPGEPGTPHKGGKGGKGGAAEGKGKAGQGGTGGQAEGTGSTAGPGGPGGDYTEAERPGWWARWVGTIAFGVLILLGAAGLTYVQSVANDSKDIAVQVQDNQAATREALVVACEHRRDLAKAIRERTSTTNPSGANLLLEIIRTDCEAEYPEISP